MRKIFCYFRSVNLQDFSATEMIKIISELVNIDQEWVPRTKASSLYIRPAMIALDVRKAWP